MTRKRKNDKRKNKDMRRIWLVRLSAEYTPPLTRSDDDKAATWHQMVVAHTAREAIANATMAVRRQSIERAQPVTKPFVISVESLGAFDSDVLD